MRRHFYLRWIARPDFNFIVWSAQWTVFRSVGHFFWCHQREKHACAIIFERMMIVRVETRVGISKQKWLGFVLWFVSGAGTNLESALMSLRLCSGQKFDSLHLGKCMRSNRHSEDLPEILRALLFGVGDQIQTPSCGEIPIPHDIVFRDASESDRLRRGQRFFSLSPHHVKNIRARVRVKE